MSKELTEWNSIHADNLRAFLRTESGKMLVPLLTALRPQLLDGGHPNKTLVRNGEVRGYELCLSYFDLILSPEFLKQPQPADENYPDLDDDSKWKQ